MKHVDVLIIGQGIAGTTLAWQLLIAGASMRVVDREETITSSRIAAGLMTPITGKRLAKSWRFESLFAYACEFYNSLSDQLGQPVFHRRRMLKIHSDEAEVRIAKDKWNNEFKSLVQTPNPEPDPTQIRSQHGSLEMIEAGQLNVPEYLKLSQIHLQNQGLCHCADLQLPDDLQIHTDRVHCPRLNLTASYVAFCQGYQTRRDPWFKPVPFRPAKGEILTVTIPKLTETRVIHHRGLWVAPTSHAGQWKVGSTYTWDPLNNQPTEAGQNELLSRLRDVVNSPVQVIDHQAAVRPIIFESRPRIGFHPEIPRFSYMNGLGSKGSLLAPTFARQLAHAILHGAPIEPEVDVRNVWGQSP